MTSEKEQLYDQLLTQYENLLNEEKKAIQETLLDRLSSLEIEKDSILKEMIVAGEKLNPSPKKHPKFKERMQLLIENQQKNLSDISKALDTNRLASKQVENSKNRANAVHSTYKKSNRDSELPPNGFRA
jgi:hypothetical protein